MRLPALVVAAASLSTAIAATATKPATLLLDTGGTRLVLTWTDATPAAACFERAARS